MGARRGTQRAGSYADTAENALPPNLPDDVDARLRHAAQRRGKTVPELPREAIEAHLRGGRPLGGVMVRRQTGERFYPRVMAHRDKARVLANVQEMLEMAQAGLADVLSGDPRRRRPGLMNLITYGRSVTFTLQNLRNAEPTFDEWYAPLQRKMADDPLMQFFNRARTKLLKEGELGAGAQTVVGAGGPVNVGALIQQLNRYAPPNTVATFFGEARTGGNGWEVRMPDGSIQRRYFQLPRETGVESALRFIEPPDQHDGRPITDTSIENLGSLYISFLSRLVHEALRKFRG